MSERGTIDAVFILKWLQEEYHANWKKICMCFVDLEMTFDRVPRKALEWAMRKKEIPYFFIKSVMSLYEVVKTWVWVDSELSEEFEVKVGMHQWSVLSPFLLQLWWMFSLNGHERVLSELLYADDLVLMSETIEGLRNKFIKWRKAFESKGLNVNLGKTKVMISGGITKDGLSKSKVDPCGFCSLRVKANSFLCGKLIHGWCAGVKMVNTLFTRNFTCSRCEWNVGKAVEQKKSCDCSGHSKSVYISTWQGKCRWWMWGCCDCQDKMWVG